MNQTATEPVSVLSRVMRRVGPGLITAAVVLGPGSIIASSRAGAERGYGLVWVLVVAALFMATYTAMAARLGCALDTTPLGYVARRWGRGLAALTGVSAFLVAAGFQFGNNIGVSEGVAGVIPSPVWIWPLVFTGLSLLFLFVARDLYKLLEKLMMALVAAMILAFCGNLVFTGIDVAGLARGFIPHWEAGDSIVARAMLATTFSAVAAFYQAYLVRAKGWTKDNIQTAIADAWIGIAILSGIALVIMMGAAATLHGTGTEFGGIGQLAAQLESVLGPAANAVFCTGLAAASFSSFIANALIGGGLLADGLGLDARLDGKPVKWLTALAMVLGCLVAVAILRLGFESTTSLLIAQGATLIAAPLCAGLLLLLASQRRVMADLRNRPSALGIGALGLGVIVYMMVMMAMDWGNRLWSTVSAWWS